MLELHAAFEHTHVLLKSVTDDELASANAVHGDGRVWLLACGLRHNRTENGFACMSTSLHDGALYSDDSSAVDCFIFLFLSSHLNVCTLPPLCRHVFKQRWQREHMLLHNTAHRQLKS